MKEKMFTSNLKFGRSFVRWSRSLFTKTEKEEERAYPSFNLPHVLVEPINKPPFQIK